MTSLLVQKLRHGGPLTDEDARVLDRLAGPIVVAEARRDILVEGDPSRSHTLILDGWACRYKHLSDGRRQIIDFFLPGDLCEPFGVLPRFLDHSLGALTSVRLARIRPVEIRTLALSNPRIERVLWWDLLVQEAIQRERTVSLGRRFANERFAHLLCELHLRFGLVALADGNTFDLPLTQIQIADALGLTAVHINRTLRDFRKMDLVEWRQKRITIRDLEALRTLGLFDPAYLQLNQPSDREG